MSHFIVGVIHKPEQDIEELLAPYDEGLEVESYVYRTKSEIIKAAKEIVNNYNEDPDWYNNDKYRKNWIKKYLDAKTEEELYEAEISPDTYEYDEDGNELTTYNPDAKWDWWVVGGRWSDTLLVPRDKVDKKERVPRLKCVRTQVATKGEIWFLKIIRIKVELVYQQQ